MKYQLFIIQCLLFINTIEYKIAEHNDYNVEVLSTTYNSITLSIYSNIGNKMGIYKGGILLKEFESDKLHPYIYRIKTSMFVSNHLCLTFFDNETHGYLDILYHDDVENIDYINHTIYDNYFLMGENIDINNNNLKVLQFYNYSTFYEIDNYCIDVNDFISIDVLNDVKINNALLCLDVPYQKFIYMPYSDYYKAYPFELDYQIRDNKVSFYLKDGYYIQNGTNQMSKTKYQYFKKTEQIMIPKSYTSGLINSIFILEMEKYIIKFRFDLLISIDDKVQIVYKDNDISSIYDEEVIIK